MTEKTIVLPSDPHGNGNAQYRLTVMVPKRRYFSYVRERWWVVMLCMALAVSAVTVHETLRPEMFSSYAELYVTAGPQLGASFLGEIKDDYATEIELLKGSRLQMAAMDDLGSAAGQLKHPIQVEVVRPMGTSILQLRATGPHPSMTQRFLQALIDEYLTFKSSSRQSSAEDLLKLLTKELEKQKGDLQDAQDKWEAFQRTNNLALLEEESRSAGTFLGDQNIELANLNLKQKLLEQGLAPAPTVGYSTNAYPATNLPAVGGNRLDESAPTLSGMDASVKAARVNLMLAQVQLAQALSNGPQYKVKPLQDQVAQIQQNLQALESVDAAQRQTELQETGNKIAAISNAIPEWETKVSDSNNRLAEADRMRADMQRQQASYDHYLAMLENVDLTKNMDPQRVTMLVSPTPGAPTPARLPSMIFLSVVLGLAAGLGIIFVWHLFDDRFVSVRDVKDQFGEKVLGLVPRIKIPHSQPKTALLQEADPRRAYWESYRHLRSALLLSELGETRPQTILFTSAMPGEGKTTVALNLARMLARSDLRTVFVDADPHGGGLHHLLDSQSDLGLLDCLRGEADSKLIVGATDIPKLNYINAGTHRDHAEGLLLRPQLSDLLADLRQSHDYIILDGAPILSADDAALLVPHADAVVLVMRPFFSRARLVRQALEMLHQRQANHVTIVFNQARADDVAGQHYYSRSNQNGAGRASKAKPLAAG